METIRDLATPSDICPYLDGETSQMQYKYIENGTQKTYLDLLNKGWRRFGEFFFRHNCPTCHKCRSIRIDISTFKPSKSMRRAFNKNKSIELSIDRPQLTDEHLKIYEEYHNFRSLTKGWKENEPNPEEYFASFVAGHQDYGYEFQYRENGKLIGIGLVDILPKYMSSVYFYYDPSWQNNSPGVYSVLKEIEFAQKNQISYLHLGYWIKENQSMDYKSRYKPSQLLNGRPLKNDIPVWEKAI